MKWWFMLFIPLAAQANTFVGNGGGAGDVELAVTRKQIEEAFRAVNKRRDEEDMEFCRCSVAYANRSVCEPVRALSIEERKFCSKAMIKQAAELIKLASDDRAISYRWTNEPIQVADRGQSRAVDAVTHREIREITINLKRFLELKPFERVFLVTHEMLHLTSFDGKPIGDEGPVGPFAGDQGSRRLLNAMGSSAAMLQAEYPAEIKRYRAKLMRSKSWKPIWFDISGGKANYAKSSDGSFEADDYSRTQLSARYALGNFTFGLGYTFETNDQRALNAISVVEDVNIYSASLGYRIFPFGDPETFWGQSHFLLEGRVDWVRAQLKLTQDFDLKYKANTVGGSAALNYYLPIFWGFWGFLGVAYEVHPYHYKDVNVKYDQNLYSSYLGVSYAF